MSAVQHIKARPVSEMWCNSFALARLDCCVLYFGDIKKIPPPWIPV